MRNGIALASAAVTTFSLVVLASVVYTYRGMAESKTAAQQSASQPSTVAQAAASASGPIADVSPQAAASIAGAYLNRTDPYSVELASLNGSQAYKVVFSSGEIVFVSLQGQVLSTVPAVPAIPLAAQSTAIEQSGGGHRQPTSGGGGGSVRGDDGSGDGGGEGGG